MKALPMEQVPNSFLKDSLTIRTRFKLCKKIDHGSEITLNATMPISRILLGTSSNNHKDEQAYLETKTPWELRIGLLIQH